MKDKMLGKRVPAEWELQRTIFMAPGSKAADSPDTPAEFPAQYHELSRVLSKFGAVTYLSESKYLKNVVELKNNNFLSIPHFDVWARDTSFIPLITDGGLMALIPDYTHYGRASEASQESHPDRFVARGLATALGLECISCDQLAFEGGAIDSDGEGTLLTTETCLLDEGRDPSRDGETRADKKARIEAMLLSATGSKKVIWLPGSSSPHDITRGHVDGVARFIGRGIVVVQEPDLMEGTARNDFELNRAALECATDASGRPLQVVILRGPCRQSEWNAAFCDSYLNFVFVNGGLVMPAFGQKERDQAAQAQLRDILPGIDVRAINVNAICALGGGIHCVTSNLPASPLTFQDIRATLFQAEPFRSRLMADYLNGEADGSLPLEDRVIATLAADGQEERPWIPEVISNRQVLRAAALAIASNNRSWAKFAKWKGDFLVSVLDTADDQAVRTELSSRLKGFTKNRDVAAIIAWRAMLRDIPNFAEAVLNPIAQVIFARKNLTPVQQTALFALAFSVSAHSHGMGFALASEFLRNLGQPGFKPDRHIMRLLNLWQPGRAAAEKEARKILVDLFGRADAESVGLLAYCILADRFTDGCKDKTRADQIIWLYGSLTSKSAKARILPPAQNQ